MSIVGALVGLALTLGLPILLIVLISRRGRSRGHGAQTVRQFFQYVILYGLVVVATIGLDLLLQILVEPAATQLGPDARLAQGLAFTLVGVPLAALLALLTRRQHQRDPAEQQSLMWAVHVTAGALTGLVGTMVALYGLLSMAFQAKPFSPGALTSLVVWGALWWCYGILSRRALPPEHARPHVLLGTLIGLGQSVYGMIALLAFSLGSFLSSEYVIGASDALGRAGAAFATGAAVWVWYWIRSGQQAQRTTFWLVLVLPVAVGGGLLMAVIGISVALWQTLIWFVGDPFGATAATHFASTPDAVAVAITGVLVWWYHKTVLAGGHTERTEITRVHEYIVSAIGLAAAAFGVGTLIVATIESVTPGVDLGISSLNTMLGAVTMLLVGVPLWWFYWSRCQRAAAANPEQELGSLTRRIYLMALFGVSGVAAVVALVVATYTLLQDVVAGRASAETFRAMRYGLGVLFATAAVSTYHGMVQRVDRAKGVHTAHARRQDVTLIGAVDASFAQRLARETGCAVENWETLTPAQPWDETAVIEAVRSHPGEDLLVLATPAGLQVVPVVHR